MSWFVPAPEPVEELTIASRVDPQPARVSAGAGAGAGESGRRFAMFDDRRDAANEAREGRSTADDRTTADDGKGRADVDDGDEALPPRDRWGRFMPKRNNQDRDDRPDDASGKSSDHAAFDRADGRRDNGDKRRAPTFDNRAHGDREDDDVLFPKDSHSRDATAGRHRSSGARRAAGDDDGDRAGDRETRRRDHSDYGRNDSDLEGVRRGVDRRATILDADFEDVEPTFRRREPAEEDRSTGGMSNSRHASGPDLRSDGRSGAGSDGGTDTRAFGRRPDHESRDFTLTDADRAEPRETIGRRLREERRRATALMKVEDLDPIAERLFNDEFFAALNVQPRELEKAIRKARRRAEAREKNRMTPLKAVGWSAWLGAIAATVFVAYAYRDQVVLRFPGVARAYDAIGIEAAPFGVTIENVAQRVAMSTSGPTIEIAGVLRSAVDHDVVAPRLRADAIGTGGVVLASWTFEADAERVRKGGEVTFVTRRPAPIGVVEISLSFADASAAASGL